MVAEDDHILAIVQEKLCNQSCTRREGDLKTWIGKVESRLWALVVMAIIQICAIGGILFEVVIRK
jgi:hypothetical protein